jgi:hypothetical protein
MIRGTVAQYAPGAIGDVGQQLVEQFAGNVERLLAKTAPGPARGPGPAPAGADPAAGAAAAEAARRAAAAKRAAAAAAALLAAGALAAGVLAAMAAWRRRHPNAAPTPGIPGHFSHEGAGHG